MTTRPEIFRVDNLRQERWVSVWKDRDGKDAYTLRRKSALLPEMCSKSMAAKLVELDHVVELHVVRDAFDKVNPPGVDVAAQKEDLKEHLKVVLNDAKNLNFTLPIVNEFKFKGVDAFQREYHRDAASAKGTGLTHFLKQAFEEGKTRLPRATTRNIGKEMAKSFDFVGDNLHIEKAAEQDLLNLLHDNMVAMRIFD